MLLYYNINSISRQNAIKTSVGRSADHNSDLISKMAHFYEFDEPISNLRHGVEREIRAKPCSAGRPSPGLWSAVAEAIMVEVVAAITAEAAVASSLHLLE